MIGCLLINPQKTDAYKNNPHKVVSNIEDGFTPFAASKTYDPFAQWSYLGKDINGRIPILVTFVGALLTIPDGLLTWIAMGVNLTAKVPQPTKRSLLDDHLDHSLHGA
jgi:hypothetical protein